MSNSKANIQKILASTKASMAVEGLKPSRRTMALGRQYLEGKISIQEAVDKVKAQHLTNKLNDK
jgi:hypothetical protein